MNCLASHKNRLAAATLTIGLCLSSAPVLAQSTGKHYVAFGDSIAANPTWTEQFEKRPDQPCRAGTDSYPVLLAQDYPTFENASCSGSKIVTFEGEKRTFSEELRETIDRLEKDNLLGTGTQLITITIGANDKWPNAQHFGFYPGGSSITADEYLTRIEPDIKRLKELAPQARILLVGYPEFVEADYKFCPINIDSNGVPIRTEIINPTLKIHFDQLNGAMAAAAAHLGVEFVDMATPFQGHNTCAPEDQRWVTVVVNNANESHLPMHISARGSIEQARIIREHLNAQG